MSSKNVSCKDSSDGDTGVDRRQVSDLFGDELVKELADPEQFALFREASVVDIVQRNLDYHCNSFMGALKEHPQVLLNILNLLLEVDSQLFERLYSDFFGDDEFVRGFITNFDKGGALFRKVEDRLGRARAELRESLARSFALSRPLVSPENPFRFYK